MYLKSYVITLGLFFSLAILSKRTEANNSFGIKDGAGPSMVVSPSQADHRYEKRIINGWNTAIEEHPYMVSIRIQSLNYVSYCSGTIIATDVILTGSQCYSQSVDGNLNVTNDDSVQVRSGSTQYYTGGVVTEADKFVIHDRALFPDTRFGVGLVLLKKNLTLSKTTQIVRLASVADEIPADVIILGWGETNLPGNLSSDLKYMDLKTMNYSQCQEAYKNTGNNYLSPNFFCGREKSGKNAPNCEADGGGPVMNFDHHDKVQIGIVSSGVCEQHILPSVFIKVSAVRSFIRKYAYIPPPSHQYFCSGKL